MPIDPKLLEILACPKCKGVLDHRQEPEGFACVACRLFYPVVDGIPNFLVKEAQPLSEEGAGS